MFFLVLSDYVRNGPKSKTTFHLDLVWPLCYNQTGYFRCHTKYALSSSQKKRRGKFNCAQKIGKRKPLM